MKKNEYRIEYTYSSRDDIRIKPYHKYLIFYAVDSISKTVIVLRILKDGMDWKYIIKQWLNHNES